MPACVFLLKKDACVLHVSFFAVCTEKEGFLMQENNYLGTEKAGRLLLQFAVPSTLALIISCLYNIVDQIFEIGRASCRERV